jgi:hypothetical protein
MNLAVAPKVRGSPREQRLVSGRDLVLVDVDPGKLKVDCAVPSAKLALMPSSSRRDAD